MRWLHVSLIAVLAFTGCRAGKGAVVYTVDSTGIVKGIYRIRVVVMNGGQTSKPNEFVVPNGPIDIPQSRWCARVLL